MSKTLIVLFAATCVALSGCSQNPNPNDGAIGKAEQTSLKADMQVLNAALTNYATTNEGQYPVATSDDKLDLSAVDANINSTVGRYFSVNGEYYVCLEDGERYTTYDSTNGASGDGDGPCPQP